MTQPNSLEMLMSRVADTADDLEIVRTSVRSLLQEWNLEAGEEESFDQVRVKLFEFVLSSAELIQILKSTKSYQSAIKVQL